MSGLMGWLIGIVSVVILGTMVDLVMDGGKMSKYIRSVFAAVTVLVIILPVPGILKNGINLDAPFMIGYELKLDENYLFYAEQVKLSALAKGVTEKLKEDGVGGASVQIEGSARGADITVTLVRINLENAVIDEKYAHIHKNELAINLVSTYLDIGKGQVIVFGG